MLGSGAFRIAFRRWKGDANMNTMATGGGEALC